MNALLDVRGLTVELPTERGWVRPVNDVAFKLAPGETLGIVGESGSGKTMLALALLGLTPSRRAATGGGLALPAQWHAVCPAHTPHGSYRLRARRSSRDPRPRNRDDLSGADDCAQSRAARRRTNRRSHSRARAEGRRRRPLSSRRCRARTRHGPRARIARPPVSASAFRRPAPTRHDRHGPRGRAAHSHRRRTDHGARRHRAEANPRTCSRNCSAISASP